MLRWSQIWAKVVARLRGRNAAQPVPLYINYRGDKPYYQKLTCEQQARSSTGPMARHSRPRR